MRIAVVAGHLRALVLCRSALLSAMIRTGHDVFVLAPADGGPPGAMAHDAPQRLAEMGVQYRAYPMQRMRPSLRRDLPSFRALYRLMRTVHPDVVLACGAGVVIYGALAAWLAGVRRRYAMITHAMIDLMSDSTAPTFSRRIISVLYRLALSRVHGILFQNPDDLALLRRLGFLPRAARTTTIHGSGVDLDYYAAAPPIVTPPTFLLIARLVADNGIREYVDAARILKALHPQAVFHLLGANDDQHPSAIPEEEVKRWKEEGTVAYLGDTTDVRPHLAACSVYVLPTYREGIPHGVLEAMSVGRPIITSDVPGCRETVIEGENGYLVPPRSDLALARTMKRFIVDPSLIEPMGRRSRQIAEQKFDIRKVNEQIMAALGL